MIATKSLGHPCLGPGMLTMTPTMRVPVPRSALAPPSVAGLTLGQGHPVVGPAAVYRLTERPLARPPPQPLLLAPLILAQASGLPVFAPLLWEWRRPLEEAGLAVAVATMRLPAALPPPVLLALLRRCSSGAVT